MAKRKKKSAWKGHLLLIGFLLTGVVFSSVSIIMAIGMIPTIVSAVVDRSRNKIKTITIGAMNFAGCAPFMIEVWRKGGGFSVAMTYITQPRTIVVMFFAAGMGYLINWAVGGIVSAIMVQRARARLKEIEDHKKVLIERWGPEVTGALVLDEFGFPKDNFGAKPEVAN